MVKDTIYITRTDAEKIRDLLREAEKIQYRGSHYIADLKRELERAKIVDLQDLSPDVIVMNSTAELQDIHSGETMRLTLVFPEQADVSQDRISVLAPIGAAMLGYRVGDSFEWDTPEGRRTFRVNRIIERQ